jgi:YD repeat-containing protein
MRGCVSYHSPRTFAATVEDSDGNKTTYKANAVGAVVEILDALGGVTKFTYDDHLKLVEETDPMGVLTRHGYDHRGQWMATRWADGARVIQNYRDDRYPELVTWFRSERGALWKVRYDSRGQATEIRGPEAAENVRIGWKEGVVAYVEEGGGVRTEYEYDRWKNPIKIRSVKVERDGGRVLAETRQTFDRRGRLTSFTPPGGQPTRWTYDLLGRAVQIEEPDGNVRRLRYDGEGNVVEAVDRLRRRTFTYTGFNWLASVEEAGAVVRFEYEKEGELKEIRNERRTPYRFFYDKCRRLVKEVGFDREPTTYKHDKAGHVVEIRRPLDRKGYGPKTKLKLDVRGRVVRQD